MASRNLSAACRKVVCIGRNYADHVKELRNPLPPRPFFFLKPPSSILPPNSGPVLRPTGTSLHYEVELALVIGKDQVRDLDPQDEVGAMETIAGYAVGIDMTARNVQEECKRRGLPWSAAKGFDTFLPVSGFIPKEKVTDPHDVELWLEVNGVGRQRDSTGLMLFRIPRLLGEISAVMTLGVGDLVLTGTPKGVGEVRGGDVMRAGVRVGGREIEEGKVEVGVEERGGRFVYGG